MKTKIRDLHIEAATTYRKTLRFFTDAERTIPLDITGYDVAAWITRGTFRIEFSMTITDGAGGVLEMLIVPEQTIGVMTGEYSWDMLVRTPSGDVKKYLKGNAIIYPTGTRLPADE